MSGSDARRLPLSVVVVAYDIARELPRTLRSLAADYQRGIEADDYEVIVVDNGSPTPVDPSVFADIDGSFRLIRVDDASPSPAPAVNLGLAEAQGEVVGCMLDGARLVSPGLLHFALSGGRVFPRTGVVTLGWYLGFDFQRHALEAGWTKADEDRLLDGIDWPSDGYRLFEIATMDESSAGGWFHGFFESNALFLPRTVWDELGGFDERFVSPGGGLVNHDTFHRATSVDDLGWVTLLGEGTFHQLHGGVATNISPEQIEQSMDGWRLEYEAIRSEPVSPSMLSDPVYLGTLPDAVRPQYAFALDRRLQADGLLEVPAVPAVTLPDADAEVAVAPDPAAWLQRAAAAARAGHEVPANEFARLARAAAPNSPEVQRFLACVANTGSLDDRPRGERVQFEVEMGQARAATGETEAAEAHFRAALGLDPGNNDAYLGLSTLKLPGPFYYDVLDRLHEVIEPDTYLEVGVCEGTSLALARPPTIAIGVDPDPQINTPMSVEFHLYRETSDEFFAHRDVRRLLGGRGPSLAFIDGLHEFSQVLEDFAQVEAISDPDTVVVFHDMIPFDEITQRTERVYNFYTGDVWKLLHCLADVRPDLSWFTVKTPPSGLTILTGLDPSSTVLRDQHEKLVKRYGALSFEESRHTPGPVVDNDLDLVAQRVRDARAALAMPTPPDEIDESDDASTVPPREALVRRVRQLEASERAQRARVAQLEKGGVDAARASILDPASAQAELEALRNTRLYRWTRPVRQVLARLRRREVA